MKSFVQLQEESNTVGVEFLFTEVSAGHTFMNVSDTTRDEEAKMRNRENAHLAYESILRYKPRVIIEEAQQAEFDEKVSDLKRRLLEAGFSV